MQARFVKKVVPRCPGIRSSASPITTRWLEGSRCNSRQPTAAGQQQLLRGHSFISQLPTAAGPQQLLRGHSFISQLPIRAADQSRSSRETHPTGTYYCIFYRETWPNQGRLHPKLEVPRLTCLGHESNPDLRRGRQQSTKSHLNSVLIAFVTSNTHMSPRQFQAVFRNFLIWADLERNIFSGSGYDNGAESFWHNKSAAAS